MAEDPKPPAAPETTPTPAPSAEGQDPANAAEYWQANIRILMILLAIWFTVSFGFGILLADVLNQIRIPGSGFKLGFWFAQQGSIYVFVALIFFYAWRIGKLDREYGVAE